MCEMMSRLVLFLVALSLALATAADTRSLTQAQLSAEEDAALALVSNRESVSALGSMYHTSQGLLDEFNKLVASCGVRIQTRSQGSVSLTEVVIPSLSSNHNHRVLGFFGEHAREIISSESALSFAKHLCLSDPKTADLARTVRMNAEVILFPIINPDGRKRVESGQYCVRSNENNVDLNRNWDAHWEDDRANVNAKNLQSFGGNAPFSEPETTLLKAVADEFKPTVFLTVHSGTLGMYMPYAYSGNMPDNQQDTSSMLGILQRANAKYCNCNAGAAGKEVGYLCSGTCLDYMYDKLQTKHSYGFEIYDGETLTGKGYSNVQDAQAPSSLLQTASKVEHPIFGSGSHSCFVQPSQELAASPPTPDKAEAVHFREHPPHSDRQHWFERYVDESDRVLLETMETKTSKSSFPPPATEAVRSCLATFNPITPDKFVATLDNWSRAYLDIIVQSMNNMS